MRSGKVLEPGFEFKTPVAYSALCWRTAHAAIGDDKTFKGFNKMLFINGSTDFGCASCVISLELKFDSVQLLPMNEQA